jgi:hypothetical protein
MIHAIDVQTKMKLRAAIRLITILSLKELLLQGKAIVGPGILGYEVSEASGKSTTYEETGLRMCVPSHAPAEALTPWPDA